MQPIKLTTAQLWLVHTLETIGSGAIVAGAITAYGAVSTGNYDYKVVGGLVIAAVLAVLTKGWSGSIQGNANFLPSLLDTANDLKMIVSNLTATPSAPQPQGPLVVVHTTQAPQEVPPPSVRAQNAIPPRPIVQPPTTLNVMLDGKQISQVGQPPVQLPQALPVVQDVAKLSTAQVQAVPQVVFPERSFSGVIPVVNPGQ